MFEPKVRGIRKLFGSVQVPVRVIIPAQHLTLEMSVDDSRSKERIEEAARDLAMELLNDLHERGKGAMMVLVER